jgi:hypothetical protein
MLAHRLSFRFLVVSVARLKRRSAGATSSTVGDRAISPSRLHDSSSTFGKLSLSANLILSAGKIFINTPDMNFGYIPSRRVTTQGHG